MEILVATPDLDVATSLAAQGFVRDVSDQFRNDVADHLTGDLVLRLLEDNVDIGFATFTVHGELIYLNGIQLCTAAQGRSCAGEVIAFAREHAQAKFLALRTQSPRMWSAGNKQCSDWFPRPIDDQPDADVLGMIEVLAAERSLPFPLHAACYGSPLYGEKPVHRDEDLQRWWDSICDFEAGDGIVCVGRFR